MLMKDDVENGTYIQSNEGRSRSLWVISRNVPWSTLNDMETGIDKALKPFWTDVKRVWSLLGNTWLTRAIIIFLQKRIDQLFLLNPSDCQLHTGYG